MAAQSSGIYLKKRFGQHFLRDHSVVERMLTYVTVTPQSSVFEVGCGEGILTKEILRYQPARLWVFEIDEDWFNLLSVQIQDNALRMHLANILDVDFAPFKEYAPWILLSNLPYQIVFPFMHLMQKNRAMIKEAVVMIQEEVAQKLVKTSGRGYGYPSLFFQHYFDIRLKDKILPGAFYPPPKVDSRLIYFKPREELVVIPDEQNFWKFIKMLFRQPRRTIKNNLGQTHFDLNQIPEEQLLLRAQQMSMTDCLQLWEKVRYSMPSDLV